MMTFYKRRILPSSVFALGVFALIGCGRGGDGDSITPQSQDFALLTVSGGNIYDFGTQPIGSLTDETFTVSNIGKAAATGMNGSFYLSVSYSYRDGAFPGIGGTCTDTLASNESCTVVVQFHPKNSGSAEASIQIGYSDGAAIRTTQKPTLRGKGV